MKIKGLALLILLLINGWIAPEVWAQKWALVMSEKTGFTQQEWRTRNHFPKQEIEGLWQQGYAITSLSHHEGWWALVMSAGTGYGLQYWTTQEVYPEKQIKEYWDKGFQITHLTYGDGKWALIMTKNSGYGQQSWFTRAYFPEEEIKQRWEEGYYISSMDYGNGLWAVVMSKNMKYTDQTYQYREYFPEKEIEEYWNDGFSITNITYGKAQGKNVWAIVMSQGSGWGRQTWQTRNEFPAKEIQQYWDEGFDITGIYHGVETAVNPNVTVTYKKPEVNWNLPYNNNIKVNKPEYTLKACVKSETPLSKTNLYVNNVLQTDSRGLEVVPDDGCDNTVERKIQLKKGVNQIKLEVSNKGGTTIAEMRTINYEEPVQQVVVKENPTNTTTTKTSTKEKRLALIIGNSKYEKSPLKNPVNDARSMEKSLKNLGFDVLKHEDLNQAGMKKAIDEFGTKLKTEKYEVALFFYAGHGLQVKGNNYLIPTAASISAEQDVEYECVDAGRVLAKMEGAGSRINIVIMDACRDNPFERSWSRSTKGNGLAMMDAPVGSIVCYSTSPGKTAADGEGNNGLYTEELLKHLNTPGLALEEVFKQVRIGVINKSNRQQTPWETSSLTGDFYFIK
ncbi:MAG: caspase family protein [Microscillaceae bacterium]|jgi:hypothetical protein|nr:caspase family protein [Microscillaceae bacterium]